MDDKHENNPQDDNLESDSLPVEDEPTPEVAAVLGDEDADHVPDETDVAAAAALLEAEHAPDESIGDDLDVSAALASISELDILASDAVGTAEDEADKALDEAETDKDLDAGSYDYEDDSVDDDLATEDYDEIGDAAEPEGVSSQISGGPFARPPMMSLRRGQLASVIPALLLMIVGAGLTFMLTSTDTTIEPVTVLALGGGALGVTFIGLWLTTERWARGGFLIGMLLLLWSGALYLLAQPDQTLNLANGWPVFIVMTGIAFVLTAFFTPSSGGRLMLIGLAVGIAGLSGLALTLGAIDNALVTTLMSAWPVILILVVLVLLAPFINRRRHN